VVLVGDPAQAGAVRALARAIAGADDSPALRAAGQAIRVTRPVPPSGDVNIMAYARERVQTAARADDPALRAFLEYWLGRAGG
jgi:hypothetical protein